MQQDTQGHNLLKRFTAFCLCMTGVLAELLLEKLIPTVQFQYIKRKSFHYYVRT